MLMDDVPVSFEGKAYVHVGFGKTIDDGPRIHIFLWGTGISFHIPIAKNPKIFAEALESPTYERATWAQAPGWFVEQISYDKVRVGIGGIVMTLSPYECVKFAHDIRMHL